MEENELKEFFWTPLFVVTGCSFVFFSAIIKLMEGPHVGLFFRIGLLGLAIGLVTFVAQVANKLDETRRLKARRSQGE